MCLIIFAYKMRPRYELILAANRDEFYSRPTATADFWADAPEVFAGRDLAAGGTWLGITKRGRFAAVTNYRDALAPIGKKSRGNLSRDFLTGNEESEDFLQKIRREKDDFSGFNLLVGDFGAANELFCFSNRDATDEIKKLPAGIYGLSNHLLDTSWQKVEKSKTKFAELLQNSAEINASDLFQILSDRTPAEDCDLPETGIGIGRERILSPAFIAAGNYGTRSSTVLTIESGGTVNFYEKTHVGTTGEIFNRFTVKK